MTTRPTAATARPVYPTAATAPPVIIQPMCRLCGYDDNIRSSCFQCATSVDNCLVTCDCYSDYGTVRLTADISPYTSIGCLLGIDAYGNLACFATSANCQYLVW